MNYEFLGFIASLFILISFIPKNVKLIRIINCIACLFWIAYGFLSNALSIWTMNILILLVNLIHLLKKNNNIIINEKNDLKTNL